MKCCRASVGRRYPEALHVASEAVRGQNKIAAVSPASVVVGAKVPISEILLTSVNIATSQTMTLLEADRG